MKMSHTLFRRRKLWLLICALLLLFLNLWFQIWHNNETNRTLLTSEDISCDIPQFDEAHIKKYIVPMKELKCKGEPYWVCVEPGRARVCPEAKQKHQGILCTYTFIIRIDDDRNKNGPSINAGTEYVELQSDYFYVNCTANDGQQWSNIMAGIQIQSLPVSATPSSGLGLNILIWGFDSLSRLQFIRGLPKTYKLLSTNKNAVILTGYNKVGEGTPEAIIPILTGTTENELPETEKKMGKKASFVNVYPFIWNDFKKSGYVTAFGEDGPGYNIFNYRLKGFNELPTHHYLRTYYISAQKYFSREKFCLRGIPQHKIMMKWTEDFHNAYPNKLKFSLSFYNELSHNDNNIIGNADEDLVNFIQNAHLNNTLMILMSDHGFRFFKINDTLQRRQEERMPFMSLMFPSWFEEKYPEAFANLRTNANRLTSPFDIHYTLQSVLHFKKPQVAKTKERGISLFNEIPLSRTCIEAGIEFEWCVCVNWKEVALNNSKTIKAAIFLINEVNKKTAPYRHTCEPLYFKAVTWAGEFKSKKDYLKNRQEDYERSHLYKSGNPSMYLLQFDATPKGQFEATVTVQNDQHVKYNIIRKDMYKLTSGCLNANLGYLEKFCVCKNV